MIKILEPLIKFFVGILQFLHTYIPIFGVDIILLTILVRIVLIPLTHGQAKSMKAMQALQPRLKELQKKYKKDKKKLQEEMMKLYSESKVNPLGGCLPLILQLPVFFGLFYALWSPQYRTPFATESFLWIPNLSKPDPFFILLILMVITTYFSQAVMTKDPKQLQIGIIMSLFMGFIVYTTKFPAGVLVYWVTTNVWTIGQQYVVNWLEKRKAGNVPPIQKPKQSKAKG